MKETSEPILPKDISLIIFSKTEANFKHPERNEDAIVYDQQDGWAVLLDGMGVLAAWMLDIKRVRRLEMLLLTTFLE